MADTAEAGAEARVVKVDDVIVPSAEANALGALADDLALPSTLVSPVSRAEELVLPTPAAAQDARNRSRHSGAGATHAPPRTQTTRAERDAGARCRRFDSAPFRKKRLLSSSRT